MLTNEKNHNKEPYIYIVNKWDKTMMKHESMKLVTFRTKESTEESKKSMEESKNGWRKSKNTA